MRVERRRGVCLFSILLSWLYYALLKL
jgi:hypothetical protein